MTYNPRTVILTIAWKGVSGGRFSQIEAEKIYRRIASTFLLNQKGWLDYQNSIGSYKIECRPLELAEPTQIAGRFYRMKLELVADNPFWLSSQPFKYRLGSVRGGKRYPLRYPLIYGRWIKEAKITNDTYLHTPITVEITGIADYVTVTNIQTGEYIKVDHPISTSQKMIIWTGDEPYVELISYDELGNEISRVLANYRLDLGSRYIKLAPGENTLILDNGIPGVLPVATVTYYKYHQGV